jgi:hypothetical protein
VLPAEVLLLRVQRGLLADSPALLLAFAEPLVLWLSAFGVLAKPSTNYLESLLREESFIAIAALIDGAVVGGSLDTCCGSSNKSGAKFIFKTWRSGSHIAGKVLHPV